MYSPICLIIILVLINQNHAARILVSSLNNGNCTIEHDKRLLYEAEKVMVKGKLYKVEDCHLHRAYQTCGTHLWFMINIVCEAIDLQKQKNSQQTRYGRFAEEKLLSEACCEHACTVNEMTRYCPN